MEAYFPNFQAAHKQNEIQLPPEIFSPLSWMCLFAVFLVNAVQTRTLRFEDRKVHLANAGDMAVSLLKQYASLAASGALPPDEAKREALARIKALRFGETGYLIVFDRDKVLMRPIKEALAGLPITKCSTPASTRSAPMPSRPVRRQLLAYGIYLWAKSRSEAPVRKVSYKLFTKIFGQQRSPIRQP